MLCMAFLLFENLSDKISPRLEQKFYAAIKTSFVIEEFALEAVLPDSETNSITPSALGEDNLFKVFHKDSLIGFAYLGQAPSMKNVFDYVVLFNSDFSIKKSKVLIYREDYGRQIGSQRWLKQFVGLAPQQEIIYGETIDAISGATISAKSMTKAISEILFSVEILQERKFL